MNIKKLKIILVLLLMTVFYQNVNAEEYKAQIGETKYETITEGDETEDTKEEIKEEEKEEVKEEIVDKDNTENPDTSINLGYKILLLIISISVIGYIVLRKKGKFLNRN